MNTYVTPACLYGTETLAMTELQQQRLQVCKNNCVRKIARVTSDVGKAGEEEDWKKKTRDRGGGEEVAGTPDKGKKGKRDIILNAKKFVNRYW